MRNGPGFGLALLLASALCGQTRSVVSPAGAGLPGVTRTLGSVVNPAQGGLLVPGSRRGSVNNGHVVAAYPIYVGGYYYPMPYMDASAIPADGSAAGPSAPPQSNVTVVMPPQQPVTPVVINYNYGTPPPGAPAPDQTAANRAPAAAQDDSSDPSHYLIAFKDHTIYAVTAYWVDGDTLHYFTGANVHNQASLTLVDREFTERLNREAGLDVRLPAPSK
jgi:hypothetical protein